MPFRQFKYIYSNICIPIYKYIFESEHKKKENYSFSMP